jgi:endo-1,4-beta-xylanase
MTTSSPKTAIVPLARIASALIACLLVNPAAATDLPINHNFDDNTTEWWTHASSGNSQTVAVSTDGRLCSVIDPTTNLKDPDNDPTTLEKVNPWDHILGISDIAVTVEQYYHVTFTASFTPADPAADPNVKREIRFKAGLGIDPFTDYYVHKAQLTATPQTFDFTYRNLRADLTSQAQFQIGGTPGTLCLDNILIEAAPTPAPVVYATPSTTGHALKAHSAMVKMGTAVDTPIFLSSPLHNAIVASEFSAITPANSMKMNIIRPLKDTFDFTDTDALVAYAAANGLEFRGHPLIWHTQTPNWLTPPPPAVPFTRDELIVIMNTHIDTLMTRYVGKFPYWDVVNEAIDNVKTGTNPDTWAWTFRPTVWHKTIGDDFIDLAFHRARAADPAAKLVYNDYNIEEMGNPKADRVFELVRDLKARAVPIDAIGFQSHYYANPDGSTNSPSLQKVRDNMARYAELGVEVHITECDFRIGKPNDEAKTKLQNEFFAGLLQACIDAPNCSHYTVWGLSDVDSWVPSTFPEADFAHIFDTNFVAKPAYHGLTQVFAQYNTDGTPVSSGSAGGGGGCAVAPKTIPEHAPWYIGLVGLLGLSLVLRRASKDRAA